MSIAFCLMLRCVTMRSEGGYCTSKQSFRNRMIDDWLGKSHFQLWRMEGDKSFRQIRLQRLQTHGQILFREIKIISIYCSCCCTIHNRKKIKCSFLFVLLWVAVQCRYCQPDSNRKEAGIWLAFLESTLHGYGAVVPSRWQRQQRTQQQHCRPLRRNTALAREWQRLQNI